MSNLIVTITKKELASYLGISRETLRIWLNKRYFYELQELGYDKKQRFLLPGQLKWLQKKLDFNVNEKM